MRESILKVYSSLLVLILICNIKDFMTLLSINKYGIRVNMSVVLRYICFLEAKFMLQLVYVIMSGLKLLQISEVLSFWKSCKDSGAHT